MNPFTVRAREATLAKPRERGRRAWIATLSCLATFACGGGTTDPPQNGGNGGPNPPPTPVNTTSVNVTDNAFQPAAIAVQGGATVTWTWTGNEPHNVTWAAGGLTGSPTQSGGNFQATMPQQTGQLVYYCTLHGTPTSGMRGTVLVE
jgi:plastocyanin